MSLTRTGSHRHQTLSISVSSDRRIRNSFTSAPFEHQPVEDILKLAGAFHTD